jgi:hypothetical protein
MPLTESTKPRAPLRELIGHSLSQCEVPGSTNHEDWLTQRLLPVLKSTFGANESKIAFVDLLFSRVETNEFFGGIAVRKNWSSNYKQMLEGLFQRYRSVGSHPDFQLGLIDAHGEDQYIYSAMSPASASPGGGHSPAVGSEFDVFYAEAAEYMPQVNGTSVSVAEWIKEVAKTGFEEHWKDFIGEVGRYLPATSHVIAVPITSPDASLDERVFPVASLFIGLADCGTEDARKIARDLCPRLIAFALRTYGVMKAEQAAKARQSATRARLLDAVQQDLTDLHRLAREIQAKASVIEGRVNPIAGGILRNRAEVAPLFDSGKREFFYGYEEASGESGQICTRCTGLLLEQPSDSGLTVQKVRSVHASSDCDFGIWQACEFFLKRFGTHRTDVLVQFLGEQCSSPQGHNNDRIAQRRHASAKLLLHRVINDEYRIFPLQVILLGVLASRVRGSTGALAVTWREDGQPEPKTCMGWDDLLTLSDWLFHEAGEENVKLEEHQACALVTTGLWQLLAVELVPSVNRTYHVIAQGCAVHWTKKSFDIEIRCSGSFGDKSLLTQTGLAASEHGLRTCISQLSRAAGVGAPLLSNTTDLAGLRSFLAAADPGRFAIGQEGDETVFFYSLPRSSQAKSFTGAAN